jgi:hypothetical protein
MGLCREPHGLESVFRTNPTAQDAGRYVRHIFYLFIIGKVVVVEAAGVELITMLTARKLLIPGSATRAKTASLPDPLYVYCTKILSL